MFFPLIFLRRDLNLNMCNLQGNPLYAGVGILHLHYCNQCLFEKITVV